MVGKAPRRFTSRGVSILPLLLMGVTHLSIPPLQSMFELEPMLMYGWYAIAVVLGLLLFRRSRVVKDHEYNRAKAMKKIRHVYEAEERGVWETNAQLDGTMDAVSKAGLKRTVGEFASESPSLNWRTEKRSMSKCWRKPITSSRPMRGSQVSVHLTKNASQER